MRVTIIAIFIVSFSLGSFADYIALRDGLASKTEILDTIGCKVKIRRNGNIIQIDKDKIEFIVCNKDTLSYKEFICTPEIANQESTNVFEDGYNSEKVSAMINRLSHAPSNSRKCLLYYCTTPINGNEFQCCWEDKFKVFESELKSKYHDTKAISNEEFFKLLREKNDTNCVLIPYKVSFGYVNGNKILGDISIKDLRKNQSKFGILHFTKVIVNVKIVDLKTQTIIYDDTSNVKSATGILFTDDKKDLVEAKATALENALLNSINPVRKTLFKIFGNYTP